MSAPTHQMFAPLPCDHRNAHAFTNGDGVAYLNCSCGTRGPIQRIPASSVALAPDKRSGQTLIRYRSDLPLCHDCKTVRVSRRTFTRCTECSRKHSGQRQQLDRVATRRANQPLCKDCGLVQVVRCNVTRCSACSQRYNRNRYVRKTDRPYQRRVA